MQMNRGMPHPCCQSIYPLSERVQGLSEQHRVLERRNCGCPGLLHSLVFIGIKETINELC